MHAHIPMALVVTFALGGAAAPAQNQGPWAPGGPAATGQPTDAITLTGCLVRQEDGATTIAPDRDSGFLLTNVAAGSRMGPSGPSNSNAPGTTRSGGVTGPEALSETQPPAGGRAAGQPDEYRLRAAQGVNLTAHIDRQVIVTGTMPSAVARQGAEAIDSHSSEGRDASVSADEAVLDVTNVTVVSESCQQP